MRVLYDMADGEIRQAISEWVTKHTPFTLATFEGALDVNGKVISPGTFALPKFRVGLDTRQP